MIPTANDTTIDPAATSEPRLKAPTVSLPKGGGAIQGLGETFAANAFTGAASLMVPIVISACRDSAPELALHYQSAGGNGLFGLGFGLDLPAIVCRTARGQPRYDGSDTFLAPDGMPLARDLSAPPRQQDGYEIIRYLPSRQGSFALIEHWIDSRTRVSFWRVIDADNVQTHYGRTAMARIADPTQPEHIFSWLLEDKISPQGDATLYCYRAEDTANVAPALYEQGRVQNANRYPERILYGNDRPLFSVDELTSVGWHFEVVFDYGERLLDPLPPQPYPPPANSQWLARPDPLSSYDAGFEIRTHRLCRNILMFHRFIELGNDPVLVRLTRFSYDENPVASRLIMVEAAGCRATAGGYKTQSMPPLEFGYTPFAPENGRFEPLLQEDDRPAPAVGLTPWFKFVDLQGQGLPGILFQAQSNVLYLTPQGPTTSAGVDSEAIRYLPPNIPTTFPSLGLDGDALLMDVTGCGRPALVIAAPDGIRYAQAQANGGWTPFEELLTAPTDLLLPGSLTADLTGDGLIDVLRLDAQTVRVYPSRGAQGYGPAYTRPRDTHVPMAGQQSQTVALQMADILGSGREHLVRIANGSVDVWPNLGYGRFGERVQLGNAPHFGADFDVTRLFLADIDGSGACDLLYVHADHIDLYLNRSGNSFAAAISIPLPGIWGPTSRIQFADVRGNGSSALVFSDAHLPTSLAYDFGCRSKPYLLDAVDNNMGAATYIAYLPSTTYALRDRQAGRPWITEPPFPIQVVDQVEAIDSISGTRLVSTYHYRHGYYDPVAREFCGFGQVDRFDAQSLEDYLASGPEADIASYTPPALTRTWYHTGAWASDRSPCDDFARDYFHGDPDAPRLSPAHFAWLNDHPDGETLRQAHLALKGLELRQEVYGLDDSPAAGTPYKVIESSYAVRQDQLRDGEQQAVFFTYPIQSLTLHYERNPADPRITQDVTLLVDVYGSALRDASIAYPRRATVPGRLPEQAQISVAFRVNQVTNLTGTNLRLLSLPVESSEWSLKSPPLPATGEVYQVEELERIITTALAEPELNLTLLGRQRTYYWSPDKRAPLPLGQATPQGLECQAWIALGTPAALQAAYAGVLDAAELTALLAQGGKYVESDGLWWNPGLLQTFLGAADYYRPADTIDPFGATVAVRYDPYHLMVVRSEDVLGNVMSVTGIDYQALAPWEMTDPNQTLSQALCDPLGMVWITSINGRQGNETVGFAPLTPELTAPSFNMETALTTPQSYLQGRASYTAYDLYSWCGCLTIEDLADLDADPADLWRTLVEQGYISHGGALRQRWRSLPPGTLLTLSGVAPALSHAIGARLATRTTGIPVHSIGLQAESYDPFGRVQYSMRYSDGFARVAQSKALVDPGPCWRIDGDGSITQVDSDNRWVVSGRTRYDNKGNPVKQYEPYFTDGWIYVNNAVLDRFGVSPLISYDPLSRKIRVDTPQGFFTKTLFCAWDEKQFDTDDTVTDSDYYRSHIDDPSLDPLERAALQQATDFFDTPTIRQFDAQGHAVRITKLLTAPQPGQPPEEAGLTVFNVFDIQGRLLSSADQRMREQGLYNIRVTFSLDGQKLNSTSIDSGTRWLINDVSGNPIWSRDSRGTIQTSRYDAIGRLLELQLSQTADGKPPRTVQTRVYGENVPDSTGLNLRGQLYKLFDSAGLVIDAAYSIQGQLLEQTRQLALDFTREADWQSLDSNQTFHTLWTYDALGRVQSQSLARQGDTRAERVHYTYDRTGLVAQVSLIPADSGIAETYVESITYDAKGQRQQIIYANGVTTRYAYEAKTFRLSALVSERVLDGTVLQALRYVYDPVGNITAIVDDAQDVVFNTNQQIDPASTYTYDAVYRLIAATGREHPGLSGHGSDFTPPASPDNGEALQNYSRIYSYDASNNLLRIRHQGAMPVTREITISPTSNHAVDAALTADPARVDEFFDGNGNQIRLPGLPAVHWSYADRLTNAILIDRGTAPSDAEYYVYDAEGLRLRKVARYYGNAGATETLDDTVYINGLEIRRRLTNGTVTTEYRTIRVMDGERCLAERLTWTVGSPGDGVSSPQVRYQLQNYLGSAVMELNASGSVITYEEYFPYGGTSFIAGANATDVKLKRYRYAGKERDEATGLYYYGARYYLASIGRWLSADPSGPDDSLNLYSYVGGNPIIYSDPNGMLRILVVGEGESFSYSYALANDYPRDTIIVTQYDITAPPDNKPGNLHIYPSQLDVTSKESWGALADWTEEVHGFGRFDDLVFNNPHAGYGFSKLQVMGVDEGYTIHRDDPAYQYAQALLKDATGSDDRRLTDMASGETLRRSEVFPKNLGEDRYQADRGIVGMNENILSGFFNLGRSVTEKETGNLTVFVPERSRNETVIEDFAKNQRRPSGEGGFRYRRFKTGRRYRDRNRYHVLGVDYQTNLTSKKPHPSWGSRFRPGPPNLDNMRTYEYRRSRSPSPDIPRRGRTDDRRRDRSRSRSRSRDVS